MNCLEMEDISENNTKQELKRLQKALDSEYGKKPFATDLRREAFTSFSSFHNQHQVFPLSTAKLLRFAFFFPTSRKILNFACLVISFSKLMTSCNHELISCLLTDLAWQ